MAPVTPKLKNSDALLKVNAGLNAAVPAAWVLKLNSNVCHVFAAALNVASVSQLLVGA